MLQSMYLQE